RHAGDGRADAQASFVSVALVRTQHRRGFLRQPSGGPAGHGTRPGVQDTGGSGGQWAHGRCRTDDRATRHQSVGSSRLRQEGKLGTPATAELTRRQVSYQLHSYEPNTDEGSYGSQAVAQLGTAPARVFKTLVVAVDSGLTVAVVPMTGQLDTKALAAAACAKKA